MLEHGTDYYIVAHPDDWQLFMGDRVNEDIASQHKVVLICVTAGDKGLEAQYWRARERGFMASIQFAVDNENLAINRDPSSACSFREVNGHRIWCCTYGTTVSYFMRLPDGGHDGKGFEQYKRQSLKQAHELTLETASTTDGSAQYGNPRTGTDAWTDICKTIGTIVQNEAQELDSNRNCINTHDPDAGFNPDDHSDHWEVGDAVSSATEGSTVNRSWFIGYSTRLKKPNLAKAEVMYKAGLLAAYERQVALSLSEHQQKPIPYRQDPTATFFWVFCTYARTEKQG